MQTAMKTAYRRAIAEPLPGARRLQVIRGGAERGQCPSAAGGVQARSGGGEMGGASGRWRCTSVDAQHDNPLTRSPNGAGTQRGLLAQRCGDPLISVRILEPQVLSGDQCVDMSFSRLKGRRSHARLDLIE